MRERYIQLYTYQASTFEVTDFDRWKYTRRNWFTDLLWKILHKLGCLANPVDTKTEYRRVIIDLDSVSRAVWKCMDGMYLRKTRPSQIFMGPKEFEKHLTESIARDFMMQRYDFKVNFHDGGYKMFDVPVHVIPHMEGILVV